ncbi:uncharacterized protein METZ01_LOCUS452746 [marine metagenome]|uniref:DUF6884 domain-containing protein n=1 Tax=marine metagenome TaxID=408172 RepID=A0A382ZWN3_9ZZZZ
MDHPPRRIGLVGCVAKKRRTSHLAQELYVSQLFTGRRSYVEQTCDEWWVLSAKHLLVHPLQVLVPYNQALSTAGRGDRRRWAARVLVVIGKRICPRPGDVFEIHAGAEYRDFGLVEGLTQQGCLVDVPTQGKRIGEQLRFYKHSPMTGVGSNA